jgi:hypothetical protein
MRTRSLWTGSAASVLTLSLLATLPNVAQDVNQPGPPPTSPGGWRKFPPDPTVSAAPQSQDPQPQGRQAPGSNYDKAIFQKPIPADQLAFLNQFVGAASNELIRDKQFRN